MARFSTTVVSIFFLFSVVLASESLSLKRRDDPTKPLRYDAFQDQAGEFGAAKLTGKGLIDSWLGKRATCELSTDSPCSNMPFCCPTGDTCCTFGCCKPGQLCCGLYCQDPGDTCCSFGTCPSGYSCCGFDGCAPKGAECCSDGNYCEAGNHCYLVYGVVSCCTDSHCTAYVKGGTTSTLGGRTTTSVPTVPTTTKSVTTTLPHTTPTITAPANTVTNAELIWYTYTITWYYYSYYWSFETLALTTMAITAQKEITVTTTISIYESDSLSAYESYLTSSRALASSTPAAATSLPPLTTVPPSSPSSSKTGSAAGATVTVTGGSGSSTGLKSEAGTLYPRMGWALGSLFAFGMGTGILMVWL